MDLSSPIQDLLPILILLPNLAFSLLICHYLLILTLFCLFFILKLLQLNIKGHGKWDYLRQGSLGINKADGPDGVSSHMLRCSKELCFPLTILFTCLCKSEEIPTSWKVPRITLVNKQNGFAPDPHFYLYFLYTVPMAFERVVHSQLYNHVFPFIPSTQFGFINRAQHCNCTNSHSCK